MDDIIIAGGGIGGLTAALSLHRAGFPVRVFESVDRIQALGVGINLLPHAVRELDALGLADDLAGQRHHTIDARLLHQARRTDLGRTSWAGGRVSMAADLDPPRRAAHHSPCRRRGGDRSRPNPHRLSSRSVRRDRRRRRGDVHRSTQRCHDGHGDGLDDDRLRRHPLRCPPALLPGRGHAQVERIAAVARPRRRSSRCSMVGRWCGPVIRARSSSSTPCSTCPTVASNSTSSPSCAPTRPSCSSAKTGTGPAISPTSCRSSSGGHFPGSMFRR